jgi:hypothetical protein
MELDEIVEKIVRNREEVYSASKAFLRGELSLEEYLRRLVRFWKEQPELIDASFTLAMRIDPVEMADKMARVLAKGQLPSIARYVEEVLSKTDGKLGRWASMVLRENFKEAGEPPVPIAPREVPEKVVREPPAQPADATEAVEPRPEIRPEAAAVPEPPAASPAVREPDAPTLVVPEPTTGNAPTIAPQLEAPEEKPPVATQMPVRREIDRAAIAAAVERAVMKARKRSPMEVYNDLYGLLSRALIGPEQPLVSLCWLIMSYLLGETNYEELAELSQDYIAALKSAENVVFRPEIRRLAVEVVTHAEEKAELRPFASFVQLCLSKAQEVRESWYRSPSS